MNRWIVTVLVGLLGIGVGYWWRGEQTTTSEYKQLVKIIGVIDGDTVVVENKERIRLRHLDAPELEFCGGEEAKKLLSELVEGKMVEIRDHIPDQQNRMMAMLYVDNKSVNGEMLKSGWVKYHSDNVAETPELIKVKDEARKNKLGIFGNRCTQTENTANPKCKIKGNIDPDNSKSRIYQVPGCVQYQTTTVDLWRGEEWFCREAEAIKAGYVKSKRCP